MGAAAAAVLILSVTSASRAGDQLQCYLPPLSSPGAPQTLDPEFDRMFLAECAPLFSAEDTPEYGKHLLNI